MKKIIATGTFALLAIALSACADEDRVAEPTLVPNAGEAVQRNIAAQLVNPAAPQGDEPITMNGDRAAIAQERYARDQVKRPPTTMTEVTGAGAGNSGAGGSGGVNGGAAGTP